VLDKEGYRPNVGIILANQKNEVFWGKRVNQHAWQFPQGGIKHGETPLQAMFRELEEEVGVTLTAPAALHGVFSNFGNFPGDHIAVFVVRHWQRRGGYRKSGEIAEARMFAWQTLPERVDPGTRARLAEIFDKAPLSALW